MKPKAGCWRSIKSINLFIRQTNKGKREKPQITNIRNKRETSLQNLYGL